MTGFTMQAVSLLSYKIKLHSIFFPVLPRLYHGGIQQGGLCGRLRSLSVFFYAGSSYIMKKR